MRPRELHGSHPATQWQNWDLNPGRLAAEPLHSSTMLCLSKKLKSWILEPACWEFQSHSCHLSAASWELVTFCTSISLSVMGLRALWPKGFFVKIK